MVREGLGKVPGKAYTILMVKGWARSQVRSIHAILMVCKVPGKEYTCNTYCGLGPR